MKYLKDGRFQIICKNKGQIQSAYFIPGSITSYINDKPLLLPFNESLDKQALYICNQLKSIQQPQSTTSDKLNQPHKSAPLTKKYRIVIDPGHGGKFIGTSGLFLQEKDLNLDMSIRLYNLLNKDFEVELTRNSDIELKDSLIDDLNERVNIAHKKWADLFISIHHNFAYDSTVRGFEIYLPTPSNWLIKTKKIEKVSSLLANNGYKNSSDYYQYLKTATDTFAGILAKKLSYILPFNGIKSKDLRVLRENLVPAVLVEIEYLSNNQAENFLSNTANRDKIVKIISESIYEYFKIKN